MYIVDDFPRAILQKIAKYKLREQLSVSDRAALLELRLKEKSLSFMELSLIVFSMRRV